MSSTQIDYDDLVQRALRNVVRDILEVTAKEGLPGDHHFYIAVRTRAPGVVMPDHLKERYPDEMTIVLQHKFWDLIVTDERFEVGLSFNQKPEKLVIPFSSIVGFADPSVQFALQFQDPDLDEKTLAVDDDADPTQGEPDQDAAPLQEDPPDTKPREDGDKDNVVTLDAFRKKT